MERMGKAQRATVRAKEPNFMKVDGQSGIFSGKTCELANLTVSAEYKVLYSGVAGSSTF